MAASSWATSVLRASLFIVVLRVGASTQDAADTLAAMKNGGKVAAQATDEIRHDAHHPDLKAALEQGGWERRRRMRPTPRRTPKKQAAPRVRR
jgi:hypothetical protein